MKPRNHHAIGATLRGGAGAHAPDVVDDGEAIAESLESNAPPVCPRHPTREMTWRVVEVRNVDGSPSDPLSGWSCAECNRGRSFVMRWG